MKQFLYGEAPTEWDIDDALRDYGLYHDVDVVWTAYVYLVNYQIVLFDPFDDEWRHDMAILRLVRMKLEAVQKRGGLRVAPVSVFETLKQGGTLGGQLVHDEVVKHE